jgi:hypothetical protein
MALVDGRDFAVEKDCQSLSSARGSADIDRRTRLAVGCAAFAVTEEGILARIRPQDLIALTVGLSMM